MLLLAADGDYLLHIWVITHGTGWPLSLVKLWPIVTFLSYQHCKEEDDDDHDEEDHDDKNDDDEEEEDEENEEVDQEGVCISAK